MKIKCLICVLLAAVFFVFGAAGCIKEPEDPRDNIIYYNIDNEPVTLDPQIANDAGSRLVILNIFEGLVRLDANNDPVPGAAESWEVSTDRMMYTFTLREGLKWSDGSDLTAEDFVFGIKRALAPETGSPTASTLFMIKNAERCSKGEAEADSLGIFSIGSSKLIIQLEYPDPDFLSVLATPPAMPCNRRFFESTAGQYGRRDDRIISNGAFFVKENGWVHDEYIYIRRNEHYHSEPEVVPAGVNISIGKDYENVCRAIENGDTDCGNIASSDIDDAKRLGLWLTSFGDTVWGISLNTGSSDLTNTSFRKALFKAIDKDGIIGEPPEGCTPTSCIIPGSAQTEGKRYRSLAGEISFSCEESAEKLLKKALKEEGLSSAPTITILCPSDEASQQIANNLIETWNKLTNGYFNKEPVTMSELRDRIASADFEAVIAPLTIQGETPLSTLELFESSSDHNAANLRSEEFDALVNDLRRNPSAGNIQAAEEAERYLLDNAVFYPLYTENRFYASAKNVENIIFHPYGAEADFIYAKKTEKS